MKKIIVIVAVFFSVQVYGGDMGNFGKGIFNPAWSPLQISLIPTWPFQLVGWYPERQIYGLSVGAWIVSKKTYGFNVAVLTFIEQFSGMDLSVMGNSSVNNGVSIGLVTGGKTNNFILAGGLTGTAGNNGVMIGIVNICRADADSRLQFGVVNSASNGWQIGLVNYNRRSMIPWMILFNYSSPSDITSNPGSEP